MKWPKFFVCLTIIFSLMVAQGSEIQNNQFISDEQIEQTLLQWLKKIFVVANIPYDPQVLILASSEVNAGATLGGLIVVYTGLILKCQNVSQLLGVLAHEVGHIAGGHSARAADAQKQALVPAIATMLLSGVAALATGSAAPLMGGLMGGSQVFERGLLKHSRDQENTADSAALKYLSALGWPIKGLREFLDILSANYTGYVDPYTLTHPLSDERKRAVEFFEHEHLFKTIDLSVFEQSFQLLKAKIKGYMANPQSTLREYPSSNQSTPARYARAIAYYRLGDLGQALTILDSLLKENPHDPFFHELKGQMLFERGKAEEAVLCYRKALNYLPKAKVIPMLLAQSLLEISRPSLKDLDEAIRLLINTTERSPSNSFAWHLLAIAYGKKGQMDQMALCLAEEASLTENLPMAKAQAKKASDSRDPKIKRRANDILMQIEPGKGGGALAGG